MAEASGAAVRTILDTGAGLIRRAVEVPEGSRFEETAGPGGEPLAPGSCVHLPPGQPHCLENTGQVTLRVLGVFHPGGSPAAKLAPPHSG